MTHHSVRVHVRDIDGQVPPSAGHAPRNRHAQGVVGLFSERDRLLIAGGLLTRVLEEGERKRKLKWTIYSHVVIEVS